MRCVSVCIYVWCECVYLCVVCVCVMCVCVCMGENQGPVHDLPQQ